MPVYISHIKLTDKGTREMRSAKAWIQSSCKAVEAMGGKMIGNYVVCGDCDYIAIAEFPSEDVAIRFRMLVCSLGYVQTKSILVISEEEIIDITSSLP